MAYSVKKYKIDGVHVWSAVVFLNIFYFKKYINIFFKLF